MKGIRGKIVHDYQAIDALMIRGVVSRQLPRLITIVSPKFHGPLVRG